MASIPNLLRVGHFYFNIQHFDYECFRIRTKVYSLQCRYVGYGFSLFLINYKGIPKILKGFSELIGMFIGLYLILYCTRRKWIWVGVLNVVTGLGAYTVWLIPSHSNYHIALAHLFVIDTKKQIYS